MELKKHEGVTARRDYFLFDPRELHIDPAYNVRNMGAADLKAKNAELKESIRANGVKVPLEVRLKGDDVYVVAGHRRYAMVMELIDEGEPIMSVPVIKEATETSEEERTLNLVTSNSGEPLKPMELAEVVRRLIAFGWDKGQIAKRIGWKSTNSVQQHLDLLAIPADVKAAAKARGVADTTLRNAVKKLGPEETLKMIEADAAQGKKTKPRDVKRAAAAKPKPPKKPTKKEQAEAAKRDAALNALPPERRALVTASGHVVIRGGAMPFESLNEDDWAALLNPVEETPQEPPATVEFDTGAYEQAGEFSGETFKAPEPATSHFSPLADETPPAPEPVREPIADAPAAAPSRAQLNGFFAAIRPLKDALDSFDLAAFADDELIGFQIFARDAKEASAALNQAMSESVS